MRTLCLILPNPPKSRAALQSVTARSRVSSLSLSYAEQFLHFSPKISCRSRDADSILFIDITQTLLRFESEEALLKEAKDLALETYSQVHLAIADSPWVAQALAEEYSEYIGIAGDDFSEIAELPIRCLPNLEGVLPWNTREVRTISTFFELLGFQKVKEIKKFSLESFRERWGKTGGWLWKKLNLEDQQVISPLEPTESLVEYMHLEDPTYLMSFLLYCLELNLKNMCLRLQGRNECAHKIQLNLYCEYEQEQHQIKIFPFQATYKLKTLMKLIEHKLTHVSLENPIRHFDIEVTPVPENINQLELFDSGNPTANKAHSLNSVLKATELSSGFLNLEDHLWPVDDNESTWPVLDELSEISLEDVVEVESGSFKVRPSIDLSATSNPGPTKILEQPRPMSEREIQHLTFLSSPTVGKGENSEWSISRGRDYYWAVSQRGQNLWVFKDHIEQKFYLHGYFD